MDPDNAARKLDTAQVGKPSGGNDAVEDVFGNPLIWKTIGSYLNMGDLLTCRLVNSEFHAMVMKGTNFLNRCLVSLKPRQITSNIFGSTSEPWKNVEIKFGNPGGEGSTSNSNFRFKVDELEWLYPILSNVESLSLRMEIGIKGGDFSSIGDFYPIWNRVLNAPKKLRALAIEPIFLTVPAPAREIQDWKDTFKHLEEFQLLEPPAAWQKGIRDVLYWKNSVILSFFSKIKNIRVFKCYYPANPFVFEDDDVRSFKVRFDIFMLPIYLSNNIASRSTNTLERVTLPELATWDHKIPAEIFPSLQSATFYIRVRDQTHMQVIREYLMTLPMLKELNFTIFGTLPSSILNAIGERSHRLRSLKIQSSDFKGTNWEFLKTTKIQEFQLQVIGSGSGTEVGETLPEEALNCLPPTVQKLGLLGRLASNPTPALARLNPSLVTELTFINSGDCFTDDTIKFIRENFKMLRLLNVTNAKRVTDAGFVASSGSGSLSGIKGLKTLILNGCGSITDATLREICFLELSHLELSDNKAVTEDGVYKMVRNNPSLSAGVKRMLRKRAHI